MRNNEITCKTCVNCRGVVFNAKWNPSTGEVTTDPKCVCKFSNHVEDKTDCKNYKNKETK